MVRAVHRFHEDLTGFRLVQAEQHAHQRTFASAVFAQQGMYLALTQLQGDIIVCLDSRELLGNVEHLDHKILCQSAHSPFVSNRHLYYSVYHYTVFLRFCTLLFDFLAGCTLISITFVQAARFFARQKRPSPSKPGGNDGEGRSLQPLRTVQILLDVGDVGELADGVQQAN